MERKQNPYKQGAIIRAQGMKQQSELSDLFAHSNISMQGLATGGETWGGGAGVYYATAPAQAATYNAASLTTSGKV